MADDGASDSLRGRGSEVAEEWQKTVRDPEKHELEKEREEDEQRLDLLVDRLDKARQNEEN